MSTVTVNSVAALTKALAVAHAGDTIQLAPGTYSNVSVYKLNFATPVTITSQDPKHAAVISGLSVYNSTGVTFSQLAVSTSGALNTWSTKVGGSDQVLFSHVDFLGSKTTAPSSQASALLIQNSSNIGVQSSHFAYVNTGVTELNNSYVRIAGNAFDHIGTDGIDNGGSSNVTIANNSFTNFQNTVGTNHPDAIQFWTVNTTTSPHDITISGNVFARGSGTLAQGIFMTDEVGLPYKNVTISDNAIVGGLWNGIDVGHATGSVTITGNTVASWVGQDTNTGATLTTLFARIMLGDVSTAKVTETGNTTQQFMANNKNISAPGGNQAIGALHDSGSALLHGWANAHSAQLPGMSSDLLSLLGVSSAIHSTVGLGG